MNSRAHVSNAVQSLRVWVTVCASVVVLAAMAQLIVFAFVRYTDIRYTDIDSPTAAPRVVQTEPPAVITPADEAAYSDEATNARAIAPSGGAGSPAKAAAATPTLNPNRVLSVHDRNLGLVSNAASVAGIIASMTLLLCAFAGVSVAGGAAVPGVDRVVRSAVWSFVAVLLAAPWSALADPLVARDLVPGVFAGYSTMLLGVERSTIAGELIFAEFIVIPVMLIVLCGCVVFWFHTGVEAGVIVTAVSQLDPAIEREAAAIAKAGVGSLHAQRTIGVLERPIGEVAPPLRMTGTDPPRRPI